MLFCFQCVITDQIEKKNLSVAFPLMQEIGGWPVLGTNPGGNWNEASFDIVSLLVSLRKYWNEPVMSLYVFPDDKNSTQRILYVSVWFFFQLSRFVCYSHCFKFYMGRMLP